MRTRWLVRTVECKAYLREYNVVGCRWCTYSCYCTWIYIGKLSTLNKIMSHQWSNNWEPDIFNEQHQCTILFVLAHLAVWSAAPRRPLPLSVFCIPSHGKRNGLVSLPFNDFHDHQFSKFFSTWGAGRCKTHSHTLLPSFSQGPNVRLQFEVTDVFNPLALELDI